MPALERARQSAKQSNEAGNLHNVGLGISMYRGDHNGEYPPDLEAVAKDYVQDRSVFTSPAGEDVRLVYTSPAKDAKPTDVVAYFWRPEGDGANVLFVDGSVQWVPMGSNGNLNNPRDSGRLIASTKGANLAGRTATDQLARSRYSLGNAYVQRGDYDEAEKQFSDALKLDAGNVEAKRGLEQLRALRSEVKGQQVQAKVQAMPAPAPAAPAEAPAQVTEGYASAAESAKKEAALKVSDLKSIEKQIEQQEAAYKAAGPQAVGMGGMGGAGFASLTPQVAQMAGAITQGTGLAPAQPAAVTGPSVAQQEPAPLVQPRLGKASLVRQVAGGRSIGALPIQIDFPAPATVSYEFVKPFLGRAEASVSFRVLRTGSVMLLELLLALAALAGYALVRRRAPNAGAGYAAVALGLSFAAMAAAPATFASAFGAVALAMGVCLAAEVIYLTLLHIHAMRTGS
jgi:prepilin-type processing-associated H-X9-DG protein